jgi:hypothetical protein
MNYFIIKTKMPKKMYQIVVYTGVILRVFTKENIDAD